MDKKTFCRAQTDRAAACVSTLFMIAGALAMAAAIAISMIGGTR